MAQKFGFTNVRIYRDDESGASSLYLLVDLDVDCPEGYRARDDILGTYLGQEKMLNCHVVVTCDRRPNLETPSIFGENEAIPIDEVNKVKNLWGGEDVIFSKLDISQIEDFDEFEHKLHEQKAVQLAEKFIKKREQKRPGLRKRSIGIFGGKEITKQVVVEETLFSAEELTDIILEMPREKLVTRLRRFKSKYPDLFNQIYSDWVEDSQQNLSCT